MTNQLNMLDKQNNKQAETSHVPSLNIVTASRGGKTEREKYFSSGRVRQKVEHSTYLTMLADKNDKVQVGKDSYMSMADYMVSVRKQVENYLWAEHEKRSQKAKDAQK